MKKPTVTKKLVVVTKLKLVAMVTSKSAKPVVNNKSMKPAGQARMKRMQSRIVFCLTKH